MIGPSFRGLQQNATLAPRIQQGSIDMQAKTTVNGCAAFS
jgi:hypothetical protein